MPSQPQNPAREALAETITQYLRYAYENGGVIQNRPEQYEVYLEPLLAAADQYALAGRVEENNLSWRNACDLPNADAICRSLAERGRHLKAQQQANKAEGSGE